MAFSLVLHGSVPKDEICGVIVGHSTFSSYTPPPRCDMGRTPLKEIEKLIQVGRRSMVLFQ